MKLLLSYLLFIVIGVSAKAQHATLTRVDSLDRRPCVTVNGKLVDPLSFFTLDKYLFSDITILSSTQAVLKYGNEDGKYGAVEISLIKGSKLLTWPEIVNAFHFKNDVKSMKVQLSGIGYYNNPKMIVASPTRIHKVGVVDNQDLQKKEVLIDMPYTNEYDSPDTKKLTRFEKELAYVTKFFFDESNRRYELFGKKINVFL
ncbi:MAG: hypothetical protein JWR50_3218 [Mucilaginibacter sp.]|nr:hypothetical protein [Mucilaginibacter sp.]